MREVAAKARLPPFFPPLFGGFFPCQETRVAVLETEIRAEKQWTQARYRASFLFPAPVAPVRPTRARSARSWPG